MAAASTPTTLSFQQPSPPIPKHLISPHHNTFLLLPKKHTTIKLNFTPLLSIDVSKEDKPISEEESEEEIHFETDKFDKRRLEEKFAVLNTGIYECRSCGYKYDEGVGDPSYPIPPGFQYEKLPQDWRCPTCGAAKSFFQSKSVEIAGFAQNQQFGFGTNAMTSGQKTILIFGSLLLFFFLFLSGYFLQ